MIKLTDEQVDSIVNRVRYLENSSIYETDSARKGICFEIQNIIESLTLPQIKQLAEQHNASVIEWVEFDVDDEATHPDTEYTDQFITNVGCCAFVEGKWLTLDIDSYYTNRPAYGVTHWAYLPTPKDKL